MTEIQGKSIKSFLYKVPELDY